MAKIEKTIVPDSTGKGSVEVTKVTHEEYPLKENENKKKEYKSNEELQRDRFSAFDAAKEDAWIPDTSKSKVEVVTEFTTVHNDHSKDYVDRNRTPKKTVKLFVALRLVRKSAKYHGVMRLSDLEIIAQKVLNKYKELKTAAGTNPIADITKHPDIKTFIDTELTAFISSGKKTPKITVVPPSPVPPAGKPAEFNKKVTLTEDPTKEYFIKTADQATWNAGTSVEAWDTSSNSKKNIKKLAFNTVYTKDVTVGSDSYKIKPADESKFNAGTEVYGWKGTGETVSKIKKQS